MKAQDDSPSATIDIDLVINGLQVHETVDAATNLLDYLRERGLTSVHAGCEHGVCGACTVLLDGDAVRACIVLAAQASGHPVETVEHLGTTDVPHALQLAYSKSSALQCGYCTPGFLMLAVGLLRREPHPSPERVREVVSSNICRCTGYKGIEEAIIQYAETC